MVEILFAQLHHGPYIVQIHQGNHGVARGHQFALTHQHLAHLAVHGGGKADVPARGQRLVQCGLRQIHLGVGGFNIFYAAAGAGHFQRGGGAFLPLPGNGKLASGFIKIL